MAELSKRILEGDVRAAASLMSRIENGDSQAKAVLRTLYARTGRAQVIGVTGAAGTGKSSLIDRMIAEYRRRNNTVGVLTVDPSSPFSGGASWETGFACATTFSTIEFLSAASRLAATGGLSTAIREAIHVLDAMAKEVILVETIGVGQDQLEIAALAHFVVVVLTPEMGDEVQAMKAGLAEIADILVVNKSDLPGADVKFEQLKALFADDGISIIAASALRDQGIQSLLDTIDERRTGSGYGSHQRKRLRLCRQEVLSLLRERLIAILEKRIGGAALDKQIKLVAERRTDPYSAVDELVKKIGL